MPAVEIAKLVVRIIEMYGSGKIINGIIMTNVPITNPVTGFAVKVTAFTLGAMLTEITGEYSDRKIDELVEAVKGNRTVTLIHTN